jgi:hypothetical protein
MKVAETGFARRKDLDFFGCEWLIKFKRAERFVFLRAQLCSNRSKFSAEREGLPPFHSGDPGRGGFIQMNGCSLRSLPFLFPHLVRASSSHLLQQKCRQCRAIHLVGGERGGRNLTTFRAYFQCLGLGGFIILPNIRTKGPGC